MAPPVSIPPQSSPKGPEHTTPTKRTATQAGVSDGQHTYSLLLQEGSPSKLPKSAFSPPKMPRREADPTEEKFFVPAQGSPGKSFNPHCLGMSPGSLLADRTQKISLDTLNPSAKSLFNKLSDRAKPGPLPQPDFDEVEDQEPARPPVASPFPWIRSPLACSPELLRTGSLPALTPSPSPPLCSPISFSQENLAGYKSRVDMLYLLDEYIDKSTPALRLVKWFFDKNGHPNYDDIKSTLPYIDGFFNMLLSDKDEEKQQFIKSLNTFREGARNYFADPLCELIENNQIPIVTQILLAYLTETDPTKARNLNADPRISRIAQKEIDFPPLPNLYKIDGDVDVHIKKTLRGNFPYEFLKIIPEAYRRGLIDSENITGYCKILKTRVAYPNARFICLEENEPLLDAVIEMLEKLQGHCTGQIEKQIVEREAFYFRSMFILDVDHLSKPQYRRGEVVGLHEYPEGGQSSYESGDTEITVRMKYPQLLTPSTLTAPFAANVYGTAKPEFRQKISTFSIARPDIEGQILAMDQTLCNPMNSPEMDPAINRRYIGLDGDQARIVYTNGRKIGTSFALPFFEIRNEDPDKECRVIPHLQVQDEHGQAPRPVGKLFSPQKKLVQFIRTRILKQDSPPLKRIVSNQDLQPINQKIRDLLNADDNQFKLIPTRPGAPVLVQVPLSACGLTMSDLLTMGYRRSGKPTSETKRLSDEEITEVFNAEKTGVHIILQYPNMDTFTRLVLKPESK